MMLYLMCNLMGQKSRGKAMCLLRALQPQAAKYAANTLPFP